MLSSVHKCTAIAISHLIEDAQQRKGAQLNELRLLEGLFKALELRHQSGASSRKHRSSSSSECDATSVHQSTLKSEIRAESATSEENTSPSISHVSSGASVNSSNGRGSGSASPKSPPRRRLITLAAESQAQAGGNSKAGRLRAAFAANAEASSSAGSSSSTDVQKKDEPAEPASVQPASEQQPVVQEKPARTSLSSLRDAPSLVPKGRDMSSLSDLTVVLADNDDAEETIDCLRSALVGEEEQLTSPPAHLPDVKSQQASADEVVLSVSPKKRRPFSKRAATGDTVELTFPERAPSQEVAARSPGKRFPFTPRQARAAAAEMVQAVSQKCPASASGSAQASNASPPAVQARGSGTETSSPASKVSGSSVAKNRPTSPITGNVASPLRRRLMKVLTGEQAAAVGAQPPPSAGRDAA
eukprot:TRINITY_DN17951_c0_g1_i2.p1 TRINITY_DN17951_c0_g1~~TRINITY_DN17951_c0_g1_i2.p1  ORF type:complete len:489 (+),score=87.18 TRINITY_DN17951_c0_g1_i2:222-1469(+)